MDILFEKQLATLETAEGRIAALLDYVESNHRKSPQEAALYGDILLQEIQLSDDEVSKAKAYILCGRTSWFKSELNESQAFLEKALEIATAIGHQYFIVQALTGIGNACGDRDEYDEALRYYFEALKIAEECNYPDYIVALYNNLGEVYKTFKAYDKALEHYQLGLHFADEAFIERNPIVYNVVRQNVGEIYSIMGDYEVAREILLTCIEQHLKHQNFISLASGYHIIAELEFRVQNIDDSLSYYRLSNQYFEQIRDLVNHIPMLLSYADTLEAIAREDEAEESLLRALEYAHVMDQPHLLSSVTSALASFYEKHSRYETALKLYKDYHDNDKKCDRLKTSQRLESVKARFESEESQRRTEHYRTASNVYKERTEDLEKAYERISLISNMGKRLTSTLDLTAIYEYMYVSLTRVMPVDFFIMSVYDEVLERLIIQLIMEGKQKIAVDSVDVHNKASLLGWCFLNNKEIISGNILVEYLDYIDKSGIYVGDPLVQSVIYIPIQFQGRAIGVLSVQSKNRDAYDIYHLDFLKALSAYIAIAINNAIKSQVLVSEIEMRKAAQAKLQDLNDTLKDLSERDGLTGVANRHRLEAHLQELSVHKNEKVTLYMIDIDFFKNYNDTYGHLKGDEVLIQVAKAIEAVFVHEGGFLARYGGEEFAGSLVNVEPEEATQFAEKILETVRDLTIPNEGSTLGTLTVSVGYAVNGKTQSFEKTLNYADMALYLSKRTGRNKASAHE